MLSRTYYPNLPWDNQFVQKVRIKAQKPKSEEEFWAYYILRRISIYFSILLSRLPLPLSSPNFITLLGIISMLLATGLVLTGSKAGLVGACLLYQVGYLFDCIDGEVARLTNKCSRIGKVLDIILDWLSQCLLLFGFAYSAYRAFLPLEILKTKLSLSWFLFILFSGLAGFAIPRLLGVVAGDSKITTRVRHSSPFLNIVAFLTSPPGLYTAILFAILLPVGISFLLKIYAVGLLMKSILKSGLILFEK